jgi:c-di-GMP-binding flagellar brake protein YcgR
MPFEPVQENELQVGQPVPWNLFDAHNNLLFARGMAIETESQLTQLLLRGLFRKRHSSAPNAGEQGKGATGAPREQLKQLDEIGLVIGDTLHLQSQSGSAMVRYGVKLIGFARGKGVIVTTPTQDGKVLLMREGLSFVVRVFSGKSVYAFSTSILKVANVPYPHLHLIYPNEVKGLIVRRGARAKVKLIAAVHDAVGRSAAANVEDLSTGGCSLNAKAPLGTKGDRLQIKFRVNINDVEQYLVLEGIVCSIQWDAPSNGEAAQARHGIQFAAVAANVQVALTAFVYHALFESAVDT